MKNKLIPFVLFILIVNSASAIAEDIDVYKENINAAPGCENSVTVPHSFISPVVSFNPETPTQDGDDVYLVFFQPDGELGWNGNLKKYRMKLMTRGKGDCDRTEPEWVISDAQGNPALDCEGNFKSMSVSFWSEESDGDEVTKGGAGRLLKNAIDRVHMAAGPYYEFRQIYTCKNPSVSLSIERFYRDRDNSIQDVIMPQDLGIKTEDMKTDFLERDRIINLVYGYTNDVTDSGGKVYDPVNDGNPKNKRKWILGDIIHSKPVVIDYFDEEQHLEYRFIAVGANDGMLHIFAETVTPELPDTVININNRIYKPGDEIWAFIPGEFLPTLSERGNTTNHKYFVDGSMCLFRDDEWEKSEALNVEHRKWKYIDKTLIFGFRRGGRSYWALDVSQPDPSKWSVKWRIKGGNDENDFSPALGYTWSTPAFARIRTGNSETTSVVVFGGGYDPEEDFYPEPWYDGNNDGKYDPHSSVDQFDIKNAAHDVNDNDIYDLFNPDRNEMGQGIFVVKLEDGSSIFNVSFNHNDQYGTNEIQKDMKWCFPSDPTVIDTPEGLIVYINDIYSQVWKVLYDYNRKDDQWSVRRIFQANPGSDQTDGRTALSVPPFQDNSDSGRKSFHSPDVSFAGTEWTDSPVLYFGTGDRVHPKYVPNYHNRFYVISDTNESADETNLINLTCDELDRYADVNQNRVLEYGDANGDNDALIQKELSAILNGETFYPGKDNICRGWYRVLGKQGECTQDNLTDHLGEMCLNPPVLYNRVIYFTTYQPVFNDHCIAPGNSYMYALDYSTGAAVVDFRAINVPEALSDRGTLADSFKIFEKSGIVSEVRVILKGGIASGFVHGGDSLFPIGEDVGLGKTSSVWSVPGGVQQLLWEVF